MDATYVTRPGEVDGVGWKPLDVRLREDAAALADAVRQDVVINAAYRQSDCEITADGAAHVALAAA